MRNKINRMMEYLGLEKYDIPSYDLKLPPELKEFWRPTSKYTFYKNNATMTYIGTDISYSKVEKRPEVKLEGLYTPDTFIARLYSILEIRCLDKAKSEAILAATQLQLKHNQLDFLNTKKIRNDNF